MPTWITTILGIGGGSGFVIVLLKLFDIISISINKKDKASVKKILSESEVDLAEVANKKVEDEVKISKAALEWTVQLAGQLEKANILTEKRQLEIDRLHTVIQQMRTDFDKRLKELEDILEVNAAELDEERQKNNVERAKNKELLEKLNRFINNGNG